ncbi:MAG: acyltransferase [Myxococcota bacterium]
MATTLGETAGVREEHAAALLRPGPKRSRHFDLFDAMRAIAVFAVIVIHVGASSGANMNAWYGIATSQGRLGVRIFFLISAFLLYRPYVVAHLFEERGPRKLSYARRRALRILPAYWVALTLLAIWPGLVGVFTGDWWLYYSVMQAFDIRTLDGGLVVAWSLTIEVSFYAALPLLALFLGRLGRDVDPRTRMQRQLVALVVLGILAEIFRVYVFSIGRRDLNFSLVSMFLPFAVGMALAVVSAWLGTDERRFRWTRLVVDRPGAVWFAAIAVFTASCFSPFFFRTFYEAHTAWTWASEQIVYVLVSALLLLPAVFGEHAGGWPRWFLGTRFMGFAGTISYGVFLWHQPLMRPLKQAGFGDWIPDSRFASLLIPALALSLLLGWLSYRLVEVPAMRLRDQPPKRFDPEPPPN